MTIGSKGMATYGINPTGLRKRPTYEEAINYLANDQEILRYPSREWKQRRESPWMTQLDADANDDYDANTMNEAMKRNRMILEASASGISRAELQASRHAEAAEMPDPEGESFTLSDPAHWHDREMGPVPGVIGGDQTVHPAPPPMGGGQRVATAAGVAASLGVSVGVEEAPPIGLTQAQLAAFRLRQREARRVAREVAARDETAARSTAMAGVDLARRGAVYMGSLVTDAVSAYMERQRADAERIRQVAEHRHAIMMERAERDAAEARVRASGALVSAGVDAIGGVAGSIMGIGSAAVGGIFGPHIQDEIIRTPPAQPAIGFSPLGGAPPLPAPLVAPREESGGFGTASGYGSAAQGHSQDLTAEDVAHMAAMEQLRLQQQSALSLLAAADGAGQRTLDAATGFTPSLPGSPSAGWLRGSVTAGSLPALEEITPRQSAGSQGSKKGTSKSSSSSSSKGTSSKGTSSSSSSSAPSHPGTEIARSRASTPGGQSAASARSQSKPPSSRPSSARSQSRPPSSGGSSRASAPGVQSPAAPSPAITPAVTPRIQTSGIASRTQSMRSGRSGAGSAVRFAVS